MQDSGFEGFGKRRNRLQKIILAGLSFKKLVFLICGFVDFERRRREKGQKENQTSKSLVKFDALELSMFEDVRGEGGKVCLLFLVSFKTQSLKQKEPVFT